MTLKCSGCSIEGREHFSPSVKVSGRLCISCMRLYARRKYQQNKNKRNKQITERKKQPIAFVAWLKQDPCTDCGGRFHKQSMQFDHVRGEKLMNISHSQRCNQETIMEQILKCQLVCANCHAVRSAARRINNLKLNIY